MFVLFENRHTAVHLFAVVPLQTLMRNKYVHWLFWEMNLFAGFFVCWKICPFLLLFFFLNCWNRDISTEICTFLCVFVYFCFRLFCKRSESSCICILAAEHNRAVICINSALVRANNEGPTTPKHLEYFKPRLRLDFLWYFEPHRYWKQICVFRKRDEL